MKSNYIRSYKKCSSFHNRFKVRTHSFARDVVQKNKFKLKQQSLRHCVRTYRSAVKGIKMSNNNKTLYEYAAIKCFLYIT